MNNGGVLKNEVETGGIVKQKFWIDNGLLFRKALVKRSFSCENHLKTLFKQSVFSLHFNIFMIQ